MSLQDATEPVGSLGVGGAAHARPAALAITRAAVVVISAYIGAQMLADIASLKIGVVVGLAVDMGTFIYPITFTLRDVAHKTIGKRNTQMLIVMAAAVNLFAAVYLRWVARVPGDPAWGLDAQWNAVFNAGLLARSCWPRSWPRSSANRGHRDLSLVRHARHPPLPVAAGAGQQQRQHAHGQPDLRVGAFGGVLPWDVVWQIFLFNLVVKYAVTLVSLPLIYVTRDADWSQQ